MIHDRFIAAPDDCEFARARHFGTKAHTTSAKNAAFAIQHDFRSERDALARYTLAVT